MPEVVTHMPIPAEYAAMGVRRYGDHGISYESIVYQLQPNVPEKLIVAHLGNGASISAIRNGKCLDTSMGLTPTGGIISGTRTGDIDPGVLLFILRKIAETTRKRCRSRRPAGDRGQQEGRPAGRERTLERHARSARGHQAGNAKARLAVDKFTWTIAKWIGSYVAELGGLDMLVFTGGIGENDIASRAEICAGLGALGIVLDPVRNNVRGEAVISAENSPVDGARDSARRRPDDREPRGAPAGDRVKKRQVRFDESESASADCGSEAHCSTLKGSGWSPP